MNRAAQRAEQCCGTLRSTSEHLLPRQPQQAAPHTHVHAHMHTRTHSPSHVRVAVLWNPLSLSLSPPNHTPHTPTHTPGEGVQQHQPWRHVLQAGSSCQGCILCEQQGPEGTQAPADIYTHHTHKCTCQYGWLMQKRTFKYMGQSQAGSYPACAEPCPVPAHGADGNCTSLRPHRKTAPSVQIHIQIESNPESLGST